MKICSICNKSKSLDQFNKQTSKNDGLDPRCRSCCIEQKNKQRRTPEGVANTLYDTQVRNCKSRGYTLPQYTKKEFREWLLKNPIFNSLYTNWVNANYEKDLKPSVDRLNDYKSYSFDNIQIITWKANNTKSSISMMNGDNNKRNVAVDWFSPDGKLIARYHSMNEAQRQTGISSLIISRHCRGLVKPRKYKTFWKYSANPNNNSEQY